MTLVLTPDGELMDHWGTRDFEHRPDKNEVLKLIANLTRFYKEQAKPYLHAGRMIPALPVVCDTVAYTRGYINKKLILPSILTSAWETEDGARAQILVNPTERELTCAVNGAEVTVPAQNAVLLPL